MADVYMYRAALYCVPCGQDLPACPNPDCDDTDHDSDDYRCGPFRADASDSPDHCDDCRTIPAGLPASSSRDRHSRACLKSTVANCSEIRSGTTTKAKRDPLIASG